METMLKKFCEKYKLPIRLLKELLPHMAEMHLGKGELIIKEGERNTNFYLVEKGIWRGYHLTNGTESSLWFVGPGEVVFSSWGYIENKPSQINVESINQSSAYYINRAELEDIYSHSVEMANFGRKIFEREFLAIDNATLTYTTPPTARDRYLTLLEENPELLQDVPLKHLASYLYITPQSLSRIRAGLKKNKPLP